MKPKHYIAFLTVIGSLFWFALMTASQIQTFTTVKSRVLFVIPFIIALFAGVIGLCCLVTQMFEKAREENEKEKVSKS